MPHARRRPGPLKAVLFDWAGTVLDYGSRAPVFAVMRVFAEAGAVITTDEARGPMGMAKRDHIRALFELPRVRDLWRNVHGAAPDENAVDRLYGDFLATQKDLLVDYATLIPGAAAAVANCRERGLKVGSSTGYTAELMKVLIPAARDQGLQFDAMVCADDVPQGRPAPWMCLELARRLDAYPVDAIVVVDDTTVGIEAGLNAGMWTVGVSQSGNLVGLGQEELAALDPQERRRRVETASEELLAAGAHFVIPTVADLPSVLQKLEQPLQSEAT
jgi:phosphonoacetaldehyde hydrolase